MGNIVEFKGTIVRETYANEDYRVYAVDVDKNIYPNIKFSKYGNAVVLGEVHELGIGLEYRITAEEQATKYGYSYKLINISKDKPQSSEDVYEFLKEILTFNQAEALYNNYPNIVDKVINDDVKDIDLSKLKGIKTKTFALIIKKIKDNYVLMELMSEFQNTFSIQTLRKLYEKYSSVQLLKRKLNENPYECLCGLARVGFITADKILLDAELRSKENIKNGEKPIVSFNGELISSKERCLACLQYLLRKNEEEGNTIMDINNLKNECVKLVPECLSHFSSCMEDESIFYDKKQSYAALKTTYDTEVYISERIKEGLNTNSVWDIDCSKYRNVEEYILTDEQLSVLNNICKYNICILNGQGGTGKSASSQAIINMLEDNKLEFVLFSPTGKAAKVLSEYTKRPASTIHRGLGYMPPNEWHYNKNNKLPYDIVIIDEFSMVDIFLFAKVLDAVDFKHTKLLLIGDNAQLPSVACGNLLHDFMQSSIIPTVTLTKVFRYGEGGLMKVATDVRNFSPYLKGTTEKMTAFGTNKDYIFINSSSEYIVKNAVALYKKLLSQGIKVEDVQVLTAYKKGDYGSVAINNELQKVANPNYGTQPFMKVGNVCYFKGDIVIQNVNNYKVKKESDTDEEVFIANGEVGIIKEIFPYYMIIDFDGTRVIYYRENVQNIGLGYCMTIHKSQGSSINTVILLTPQAHTYMLNSNIIYVGLTRMKQKCFHLGNINTVNIAVKKKANLNRNTVMQQLLKQS